MVEEATMEGAVEAPEPWVYRVPWLCGEEAFLDSRLTWDTTDPDPSVCLQKSLLIWLPCGFLWLLAPIQVGAMSSPCPHHVLTMSSPCLRHVLAMFSPCPHLVLTMSLLRPHLVLTMSSPLLGTFSPCTPHVQVYRLYRSKARHIPHSLLSVVKTVLAGGLLLLALADLVTFAVLGSGGRLDMAEAVVRAATWCLVVALVQAERARGCRNSPLLWVFWLLYILTQVGARTLEPRDAPGAPHVQPGSPGGPRPARHTRAPLQHPHPPPRHRPVAPRLPHGHRAHIRHRSR